MTAPADLDAVRAALDLVAQATHGPWRTFGRWPHLAVVSGHVRPRIVASLASASDDVDDTPKDAAAIVALRNAAPAIAAAVEELTAARAEIAALNRQVCRLVSGDEIDGDRLCQHHGAEAAALALLADERTAHAETSRDLDALLTALGAKVTPGGQTLAAGEARRVADGLRRARELVAAREVPADVEAAIASLVAAARDATNYEPDRTTAAKHLAAERLVKESIANLRTAIAAEIERARAEGWAESPAAPATVARPISEWHEDRGSALWWRFPVEEPPYSGSPLDSDWPGYHTHWTPIVCPDEPHDQADADPASRGPIGGGP